MKSAEKFEESDEATPSTLAASLNWKVLKVALVLQETDQSKSVQDKALYMHSLLRSLLSFAWGAGVAVGWTAANGRVM